ncbi:phage tail protein [Acinetobacter dispersus]|uniref:phage tail-collar fiber domain-containing protein n=1 Tax=Acinetobacter dispersus TaxID=70348 RepID=UPI00132F33E4|nr:phage tail protein [Acinetobacter dispersus]QHH99234.1 hypothetical protein FPL17_17475 [Acinetobacter dispersus]
MTAIYYVTPTNYGLSLIAQAHNTASISLINLVLGDANGSPYDPISNKQRTTLVNQRAMVPVQSVEMIDTHTVRIRALVGNEIGGFNIHEIGLTDPTGKLVYLGNYHGGFKPVLAQGAGGELQLYIDVKPEQGGNVLIQAINPISASQPWVLQKLEDEKIARELGDNTERDARIYVDDLLNSKIDTLRDEKNLDISFIHERINSIGILAFRDLNPLSTRFPIHYAVNPTNYDAVQISTYYLPGGLLKQTIKVHANKGDENLHIYLPVSAARILHVSTTYQSGGYGSHADDDSYSRLVNIYEEGPPGDKQTVLVVRTDYVSDADPANIDRWIWIEVTCLGFTQVVGNLDYYPYSRNN